jgi:adenylate cyclase
MAFVVGAAFRPGASRPLRVSASVAAMSRTALHGDVSGYSRLIADNEIETINTLRVFTSIIETVVAEHSGDMGGMVGDEFLAVLPSASDAVHAALEMQRLMAEDNQLLPTGRRMRFRLGLHCGVIGGEAGRWYGDVVNIAARLQALADPGGVMISAAVLNASNDVDVRVEAAGQQRLKNIPDPVLAYRLIDDDLSVEEDRPWRRRIPTSEIPSLAVSPFVNLGEPDQAHFAAGLMMSLITALMRIPGLDVVSENSTLKYSDTAHSAQQVGHEVGARFVLEGAVQRIGARVRVMAQVIDVEAKKIVWSDKFDERIEDLFATQDELVKDIVVAIDVNLAGGVGHGLYREQLDAATVEVLYKGWNNFIQGTAESTRKARNQFEEIALAAPGSAIGPSMAAWTYLWEVLKKYASDRDSNIDKSEELAKRALEIDDPSGFSDAVMAYVRLMHHDWDGAYESAQKATTERPSCDVTYGVAASVMRYLGHWEEAVDFADRAIHLSPLLSDWYTTTMANAYFIGEDYEMAVDAAEGVVSRDERDVEALLNLAASQSALGRDRHASAAIHQARRNEPTLNTEDLRQSLPYKDDETLERFITNIKNAGLE